MELWRLFLSHSSFWINTVCPPRVATSIGASVFLWGIRVHCSLSVSLCLPSLRCISEPVVPAGDHLWSGSLQRLPLCIMEVVLGATEWPFPPGCPQGGALPGRRPTACPYRGRETKLLFGKVYMDWATFEHYFGLLDDVCEYVCWCLFVWVCVGVRTGHTFIIHALILWLC